MLGQDGEDYKTDYLTSKRMVRRRTQKVVAAVAVGAVVEEAEGIGVRRGGVSPTLTKLCSLGLWPTQHNTITSY